MLTAGLNHGDGKWIADNARDMLKEMEVAHWDIKDRTVTKYIKRYDEGEECKTVYGRVIFQLIERKKELNKAIDAKVKKMASAAS